MSEAVAKTEPRKKRRWLRAAAIIATILFLCVAGLPSLLSLSPLRNAFLRWIAGEQLQITTDAASIGWFTSLQVYGLSIADRDGASHIQAGHIGVEKRLLTLLFEAPRFGTVTVDKLKLDLVATQLPAYPTPRASRSTFRAEVRDAAIIVRDKAEQPPVVDLGGFDLMLQVSEGERGRVLTVDPTELLSQQELSPDLCHRGLQLIAPVLANAAQVDGKVSLRLDQLRVALDQESGSLPGVEMDGHLVLHRVSAGLRNPLLIEIAQSVSRVLRAPLPSQVKLADEANVHFWVANGRVFHDGLAFGLPELSSDLVLHTHGSVGLDRSLDLLVDVPLPLDQIHDGPILRMLSERPLQLQVRGTFDQPVISLPADRPWYRELAQRLGASIDPNAASQTNSTQPTLQDLEPLADAVLDSVGAMLQRRRQKQAERNQPPGVIEPQPDAAANDPAREPVEQPPATPLLNRWRNFRNDRSRRDDPPPP